MYSICVFEFRSDQPVWVTTYAWHSKGGQKHLSTLEFSFDELVTEAICASMNKYA